MTQAIDLNCDMGESYGAWKMGDDEAILPYVSSANIACGFHGGDPAVMRRTVTAALRHGVSLGAHPSLPDLQGFGRRTMQVSPQEAYDITVYQVGALAAVAASQGARLNHVKPHGALYNLAARDRAVADAIAAAVHGIDPGLWLYALAGSALARAGRAAGLRVAEEAFAERGYTADGRLAPRGTPGAVIERLEDALAQVRSIVREGVVTAVDGIRVPMRADTLCLHGDRDDAACFAAALRRCLEDEGITISTPGSPQ